MGDEDAVNPSAIGARREHHGVVPVVYISRKTGYKLRQRYLAQAAVGVAERAPGYRRGFSNTGEH